MATNKTIVSKDILDAMNNIVSNKGNYETAKIWNGDYEQYRSAAQPSYQYLLDNGWGDVADSFSNSNYISAQDILKRYGLADSSTDKAGDFASSNMSNLKSFLPDTASTYSNYEKGIGSNYTDFTDSANNRYKDTQRYLEPYANNLNDLYGKYSIGVDTVNNQNNQLWNDMRQFGTEQTGRYDKLTDYIYNNDYTATPWYETIMQGYNLQGGNAAGDAIASAGGSNSGNIDSYAAANANRQQLSFTNAGNNAALNAYNSQIGNLLGTIQSLGYDIGNLQNRQQANVDSSRNANQGMLDSYNQGNSILGGIQNDAVANLMNAYGMAGDNYNTGYNNLMGAQNQESDILSNAYNNILGKYTDLDTNEKNYDLQQSAQKNSNEQAQQQAIYDYLSKIYATDADMYKADTDLAGKYYTADSESDWRKYLSDNDLLGTQYSSTMDYNKGVDTAGIQSAASQAVAGINAGASMYGSDRDYQKAIESAGINANSASEVQAIKEAAAMEQMLQKNYLEQLQKNPAVQAEYQEISKKLTELMTKGDSRYGNTPMSAATARKVMIQDYGTEATIAIDTALYTLEQTLGSSNYSSTEIG